MQWIIFDDGSAQAWLADPGLVGPSSRESKPCGPTEFECREAIQLQGACEEMSLHLRCIASWMLVGMALFLAGYGTARSTEVAQMPIHEASARVRQSGHTATFQIEPGRPFPQSMIRFVSNSHMDVYLPLLAPHLKSPGPPADRLYAVANWGRGEYGVDFYWGGVQGPNFGTAYYGGSIDATQWFPETIRNEASGALSGFSSWKPCKLDGRVSVERSTFTNAAGLNDAITWHQDGWKLIVATQGNGTAAGTALAIERYAYVHKGIIPHGRSGWVIATWFAPGRPLYTVAARLHGEWYIVSSSSLSMTLETPRQPVISGLQTHIQITPDRTAAEVPVTFYKLVTERKFTEASKLLGPQLKFETDPTMIKYLKNIVSAKFLEIKDISKDVGRIDPGYKRYYRVKVYYGIIEIRVVSPNLVSGLNGMNDREFVLIKMAKKDPWLMDADEDVPKIS